MFFEFKMHRICAKNKVKQRIEENYEGKFNNRVDTEKSAGSRVLLAQHPRPSRFSGHDWRSVTKK